jgi:hypothetical protein
LVKRRVEKKKVKIKKKVKKSINDCSNSDHKSHAPGYGAEHHDFFPFGKKTLIFLTPHEITYINTILYFTYFGSKKLFIDIKKKIFLLIFFGFQTKTKILFIYL